MVVYHEVSAKGSYLLHLFNSTDDPFHFHPLTFICMHLFICDMMHPTSV